MVVTLRRLRSRKKITNGIAISTEFRRRLKIWMITLLDCIFRITTWTGNSGNERAKYDARKSAFFKATFLVKMAYFRLTHAYVLNVIRNLPGPCTTFSLSVNSLRWPIRGEHFRLDDVTPSALAARNNEAKGLGKSEFSSRTIVSSITYNKHFVTTSNFSSIVHENPHQWDYLQLSTTGKLQHEAERKHWSEGDMKLCNDKF